MQVSLLNTENYRTQSDGDQVVLTCVILSAHQLSHNSCHTTAFIFTPLSAVNFKLNSLKNTFLF